MKEKQSKEFDRLFSVIDRITDFNPVHYKIKPLGRRIKARMRRLGINNYEEYTNLLIENKEEVRLLKENLTINFTSFFRNKSVFDYIKNEILPTLDKPLIWSAGCASGEEVYTLSILCNELNLNYSIMGTDIDRESLKKAEVGIYDDFVLKEIDPEQLVKYFTKVGDKYKIIDKIKKGINFQYLNLNDVHFKDKFNLIICRNVLIYLSRNFQEEILAKFYRALRTGGYLILGKVESPVGQCRKLFYSIDLKNRIYGKRE